MQPKSLIKSGVFSAHSQCYCQESSNALGPQCPTPLPVLFDNDKIRRRYSTVGGVWDVWGGPEIADGLHSASLPRTAQMNPLGKRGGLPTKSYTTSMCDRTLDDDDCKN